MSMAIFIGFRIKKYNKKDLKEKNKIKCIMNKGS